MIDTSNSARRQYNPKIPFGAYRNESDTSYLNVQPWNVYIKKPLDSHCNHILELLEQHYDLLKKTKQQSATYLDAIVMIPHLQYFNFRTRRIINKSTITVLYGSFVSKPPLLENPLTKKLYISLVGIGKSNLHILVFQKTSSGIVFMDDNGTDDIIQKVDPNVIPNKIKLGLNIRQ